MFVATSIKTAHLIKKYLGTQLTDCGNTVSSACLPTRVRVSGAEKNKMPPPWRNRGLYEDLGGTGMFVFM